MQPVLRVDTLVKRFGATCALGGVSFAVAPGEVVGLVGPNGAGKTTALRIVAGYLWPDGGRVEIGGCDVVAERARALAQVGYLPEAVPAYPEMRVEAYLRYRSRLKGVPRAARRARIDEALALAGAEARRGAVIGALSKGLRQRVGLADALLAAPPLLLLDEPTSGLDPVQVRSLRGVLAGLAATRAVVLSSHQLGEIRAVASRVVAIVGGRVVADATPDELAGDRALEDVFVELATRGAS